MLAIFTSCSLSLAIAAALLWCGACSAQPGEQDESDWSARRAQMVDLLRRYGIQDVRVLAAMGAVRRHRYIPEPFCDRATAYADAPAMIGFGQTISQPFIVAYMTEKLKVKPGEKVLEIGTGSGYQAAILAQLGAAVFTVEIIPKLAEHARRTLAAESCDKVRVRTGDGFEGWSEFSPFDAIIVTCAPDKVPQALVDQLKDGGRMVIPVGGADGQRLVILSKRNGRVEVTNDLPVRFVPMVKGATNPPPAKGGAP
jgi:protein-L-isoaspartate(D-aspartate) O-methyltransferase